MEDIRAFEKTYKGSDEELDDLKAAYLQHEGDMDHILEEVCGGGGGMCGEEGTVGCVERRGLWDVREGTVGCEGGNSGM